MQSPRRRDRDVLPFHGTVYTQYSERTATPLDDYAAPGKFAMAPEDSPGLFHGNAAFLLREN